MKTDSVKISERIYLPEQFLKDTEFCNNFREERIEEAKKKLIDGFIEMLIQNNYLQVTVTDSESESNVRFVNFYVEIQKLSK